jgi:hypothetical protein
MSYVPPTYVKCPRCGWVHFVISEQAARQSVADFNDYAKEHEPGRTAEEHDAPMGATIQPVVIER